MISLRRWCWLQNEACPQLLQESTASTATPISCALHSSTGSGQNCLEVEHQDLDGVQGDTPRAFQGCPVVMVLLDVDSMKARLHQSGPGSKALHYNTYQASVSRSCVYKEPKSLSN